MAYGIEFKSIGLEKDMEQACVHALAQIHKNNNSAAVQNTGISPELVRNLAIILQGKRVMVGEEGLDKAHMTSSPEDLSSSGI